MISDSIKLDPTADDDERDQNEPSSPRPGKHQTIRIVAMVATVLAATYILYQRLGTSAQASEIEFMVNLSGGFLAVGMTDADPGFVVLSALDREQVAVRADHYANVLSGDFTVAEVRTPRTTWHRRLRGPVVVVVDQKGVAEEVPVDWSLAEFTMIRSEVDCGRKRVERRHRCGAPFAELFDLVEDGQVARVPKLVREFLVPFAAPRKTTVNRNERQNHVAAEALAIEGNSEGVLLEIDSKDQMPTLKAVKPSDSMRKTRELLGGLESKPGRAPDILRTMANSSVVLEAYLAFNPALAKGSLSARSRLREQIALAVGEAEQCNYCLAAHTAFGMMAGRSEAEMAACRRGGSSDAKTAAALAIARKLVRERGWVAHGDLVAMRAVVFDDGGIAENGAIVAVNIFTNYLNHVALTLVDFPEISRLQGSAACACA